MQHRAIDVPLAAVITAVSGGLEEFRQQARPWRTLATSTAFLAGEGVAVDLLRVVTGENGTALRPAARGVVKSRETQAVFSECIQTRRHDFPAVTAEIGIAHIIGEDEQDIRPGRGRHGRNASQEKGETPGKRTAADVDVRWSFMHGVIYNDQPLR